MPNLPIAISTKTGRQHASAYKSKPKRARSTKNIAVAVEKAIDLVADYMQSLRDADLRSVLAERLLSIANWKPEPEPPAPAGPEPTPVQKGKKKTAIDYENIAMRYLPDGYRVKYRESISGRHYGRKKLIEAPRPVTPKSLYIFLHECGHAQLAHSHSGRTSRHVEEMEAEQWAHARMAEHGIAVPPELTEHAKRYVARKIAQAERRNAKTKPDPRAVAYAADYLPEMRAKYEKWCGPPGQSRVKFR